MNLWRRIRSGLAGLMVVTLAAACAAGSRAPAVSHDGLVLQTDSKVDQLYMKPGVTLDSYDEFGLAPCEVAFRKNWLRDQNRNRIDMTRRVTQRDVDRIKDRMAEQCDKYFLEALQEEPAYNIVENFTQGESVLVLQPSIIDLDINAPDTMSPGISRTYTTSAGEATLFLEAVDGTTGEILLRAVDRRRDTDTGYLQWTNSVTNKAEADRALRYWAGQLRKGLDRARAEHGAN